MILEVGLTGGIASGKSTVARLLSRMGCVAVDADTIVAELYLPGAAGHQALVAHYGTRILRADQTIDRGRLADLAFASDATAGELNAIIHPLVRQQQDLLRNAVETLHAGRDRILVVEATLLVEAGSLDRYDRIVVVDVAPETQLARAKSRGMAPEEAARRMAHQMSREERLLHADYILENTGDLAALEHQSRCLHELLRQDLDLGKRGRLEKKTPRRLGGASSF